MFNISTTDPNWSLMELLCCVSFVKIQQKTPPKMGIQARLPEKTRGVKVEVRVKMIYFCA